MINSFIVHNRLGQIAVVVDKNYKLKFVFMIAIFVNGLNQQYQKIVFDHNQ